MDLLGLPGYRIIAIDEHGDDFHIQVELLAPPLCCVHCGKCPLHRHELKQQQFTDHPMREKPVRLIVHRKRYLCPASHRTFFESVPEMDEHHFLTRRLTTCIEHEALRRTFTNLVGEVVLIEWTIRSIFRESTAHLKEKAIDTSVTVFGIDEVHLLHKPRCVLTDIEQRTIRDLLRNRDKVSVKNYLQRLPP